MAESPLTKLARIAGGAAMLPGPLGHQVLGQLLISRSTGTELAGANVVLAAVSRQTNAAVQVAVRSMVPAVLVEALSRKERRRIARMSSELAQLIDELERRYEADRSKPERMKRAQQAKETSPSLEEAMLRGLLMVRCSGGQSRRRVEALEDLLDGYVPAKPIQQQKGRSNKPKE